MNTQERCAPSRCNDVLKVHKHSRQSGSMKRETSRITGCETGCEVRTREIKPVLGSWERGIEEIKEKSLKLHEKKLNISTLKLHGIKTR